MLRPAMDFTVLRQWYVCLAAYLRRVGRAGPKAAFRYSRLGGLLNYYARAA